MSLIAVIGMLILGLAYFGLAFWGFCYWIGPVWSALVLIVCFWMRSTWVVSIGVFLAAYYVFGWHWAWATLLAFPGLLVIPVAIGSGLSSLRKD